MIFEVKNGSFGYKKENILNNISFSLNKGEVMSVLGSNGVGKTTLLKCMMGFLKWKEGTTYIYSKNMKEMPSKEIWQKIAYVPQSKGTGLSYTAEEMVLMGRSSWLGMFSQPSDTDYEIVHRSLERVGVLHLKDKKCSQMSGGELQMVLIARALSSDPEMLILDEPESNLDFKNQLIVLETIQKLSRESGIAAIVNTHYPAHALKISDKTLILNRDGTSIYGSSEETITEENMERAFSVKVKIQDIHWQEQTYKSVIAVSTAV